MVEVGSDWRQQSHGRPCDDAKGQDVLTAEAVGYVAAGDLSNDVSPEEGRLYQTGSGLTPAVVLGHGENGNGDVDAVTVTDNEGEKTEQYNAQTLGGMAQEAEDRSWVEDLKALLVMLVMEVGLLA